MIKRIVKMSFKPECIQEFTAIFNSKKQFIAAVEGCSHVELLQDIKHSNVFFTYSIWQDEYFLETYRQSELFADVWAQTKVLFNDKPEAWSLMLL